MPIRCNRCTELLPAPPQPTTRTFGLAEPAADVLAHRVTDGVLHGDGVAGLDELLKVHHVPFRQFDHELANVVRRELDVDEPIDRGANDVGDRGVVPTLDELMQRAPFVGWNSDRHPFRFGRHMDPDLRPTDCVVLSDIRMAITLFKHMSTGSSLPRQSRATHALTGRNRETLQALRARIRLFFGLCSTSAKCKASSTGGTYIPN